MMRRLFDEHFKVVWRAVRRLGLSDSDADDATQLVFIIASRRLDSIAAHRERAFLLGVAFRVVVGLRRGAARRFETPGERLDETIWEGTDLGVELDRARAQNGIAALLASMPSDLRSVFVLFEIEGLTLTEIARTLHIPRGTAASRLRRSREWFEEEVVPLRDRFT
jgi:RNA polymerase sigma-70 factor (ECF subfamily)